ncbi:hypothetical protein K0M31_005202 [Melipona bicolor]|uniref:Uncharacterized protein n=1 Tax=Melipona bicolor TaxID=60889 RepID=A0AA40KMJ4_9HYME|nr:hypothetical protein K0M31_005202 [Melipona bicolor]
MYKFIRTKCKSISENIEYDTINKLSYQPWTPIPKEHIPWAFKDKYQPPTNPMCADTIYQVSYPAPGYYEDICEPKDCECLDSKCNNSLTARDCIETAN